LRKTVKIAAVACLCTMMCGCLETPPLTDQEMDIVAEYAADLLLRHDKNYQSSLMTQETYEELTRPSATPTPSETMPEEPSFQVNTPEAVVNLTQVIDVEGFVVSCDGYDTTIEVVRTDYMNLVAKEGRQYMVVHFTVMNVTDQTRIFNASDKKLECSVDINQGTVSKLSISMMENDLQYMPIEVPAGAAVPAILVFDISAKETIDTAHLIMKNKENKTILIQLD